MAVRLDRLKPIDYFILYSIYESPSKEIFQKEVRPAIMYMYRLMPEKSIPTYQWVNRRINALIDMGLLYKKSEKPMRIAVAKKYYGDLMQLVTAYMQFQKLEEI